MVLACSLLLSRAVGAVTGQQARDRLNALREAFRQHDVNGDGVLDVNEVMYTLKAVGIDLTRPVAEQLVDTLDQNGDGESSLLSAAVVLFGLSKVVRASLVLSYRACFHPCPYTHTLQA